MPAWPSIFPAPLFAGYALEPESSVARTDMDVGPARHRRRYTAAPTMTPCAVILSNAQFAIFEAWHRHELQDGSSWFTAPVRNGQGVTLQECRFVEPWKASPASANLFSVTMKWEVRDRPVMSAAALAVALGS